MNFIKIFYFFFYLPLIKFLSVLFCWHPKIYSRIQFEKKNFNSSLSDSGESFSEEFRADFCFEFSSEGEYQQVLPLIESALEDKKKIEIIFFSPSVENVVFELARQNQQQIRILRFPLLSSSLIPSGFNVMNWITAKKLILVRYDLFPDFYLWSLSPHNCLVILWGSFKKERIAQKKVSWWKKKFFQQVDYVIFATQTEANFSLSSGMSFPLQDVFDFRKIQIKKRSNIAPIVLQQKFPLFSQFLSDLTRYSRCLIMGNIWASDLFLIENLTSKDFILIVPHVLHEENLKLISEELNRMNRSFQIVEELGGISHHVDSLVLNKKGVLCELYRYFNYCYVGGGFEGSVHSLLEPLFSSQGLIACGPHHFRSTEYDVALEEGRVTEVNNGDDVERWLEKRINAQSTSASFTHHLMVNLNDEQYDKLKEKIFSC